ncbi:MAG: hypothetical protein ABSD63_17635 [Candidatus Korobacteraceae bacterium]|jgi:hypothetical protein
MLRKDILALLEGGDRRTIGRADEVAAMVADDLELFPKLIAGLWLAEAVVRTRAADAVEKVKRERGELLQPYKKRTAGIDDRGSGAGTALASGGDGSTAVAEC